MVAVAPASHHYYFTLGAQSVRLDGWSVASKSQLQWQVTVSSMNHHYPQINVPKTLCVYVYTAAFLLCMPPPHYSTWSIICINSLWGATNANAFANSTISLWQMKKLTFSQTEIQRFGCSFFLNLVMMRPTVCLMIMYGPDLWTCKWFLWNIRVGGKLAGSGHVRGEIVKCIVVSFHYYWWLVVRPWRPKVTLLPLVVISGYSCESIRLKNK